MNFRNTKARFRAPQAGGRVTVVVRLISKRATVDFLREGKDMPLFFGEKRRKRTQLRPRLRGVARHVAAPIDKGERGSKSKGRETARTSAVSYSPFLAFCPRDHGMIGNQSNSKPHAYSARIVKMSSATSFRSLRLRFIFPAFL